MTQTFTLEQIKSVINIPELIPAIEEGFVKYSSGDAVVPPVGYLEFENPPGSLHIKYGYLKDDPYYVIKIATGFYDNSKLGIPASQGLMLVLSQKTGALEGILLDEGHLTDLRTAIAGAIAAKYLAPKKITSVGIVGTGVQARLQLELLPNVCSFEKVVVWGRNAEHLQQYKTDMEAKGFAVETTEDMGYLSKNCNLIVMTTPTTSPLITADQVQKGTHITAVGADAPGKQELDEKIIGKADVVVADSISQCVDHGEIHYAVKNNLIKESDILELGAVIADSSIGRSDDSQISVADLTGVAVQDIQISKMVYEFLTAKS